MIIYRKTRKNIIINSIEELRPYCKKVSKDFKDFTPTTLPLFKNLIEKNSINNEIFYNEIKNILDLKQRNTR